MCFLHCVYCVGGTLGSRRRRFIGDYSQSGHFMALYTAYNPSTTPLCPTHLTMALCKRASPKHWLRLRKGGGEGDGDGETGTWTPFAFHRAHPKCVLFTMSNVGLEAASKTLHRAKLRRGRYRMWKTWRNPTSYVTGGRLAQILSFREQFQLSSAGLAIRRPNLSIYGFKMERRQV